MKEQELRNHAVCSLCDNKILSTGLPLFWRVTVERFGIDIGAVSRLQGLTMTLGSPALASAMGADEDMAIPVMEAVTITVCEKCALDSRCIASLAEI